MNTLLLNAIAYNAAWFVCVKLAEPWCFIALILVLLLHFSFTVKSDYINELLFLACVVLTGFIIDSTLGALGVLQFHDIGLGIPVWLFCLWFCFATTIRYCLSFLSRSYWLAALFGATGGAFSYFMGAQFNDSVSLRQPLYLSVIVLALVWGLLMPFFTWLATRFESLRVKT